MHTFISKVRRRLNTGIAINSFLLALLIASALIVSLSLYFIIRGHAVETWAFITGGCIAILSWIALWVTKKKNTQQAAIYSDSHFQLKDSIVSSLEFENGSTEQKYKELQYAQTEKKIASIDSSTIPLSISKKLLAGSLASALVATSFAFVPASQAVLDRLQKEKETKAQTEEIQKLVEAEVEKLLEDLSEHEKALIDSDQIRKWAKELKPTAKEREAMLNMARVKQEIQKKIAGLENRKNEALLKAAGLKLKESSNSKAKQAGEAMSQKDFDAVKKSLEKFKLKNDQEKEHAVDDATKELMEQLKKGEQLTPEERKKLMEEFKKKLAEVRELTKRMAAAAQEGNQGEGLEEGAKFDNLPEDFPLDRLMKLMNKHAMDMQEFMDGEMLDGELMELEELMELLEMLEEMDEGLEEMQDEMDEMEARRSLRQRLQELRKRLGSGMGKQQGQKQGKGLRLNMPGGKKPGTGTDNSRRNQKDEDIDNKNHSKIKGQQGKGPVQKKIEAADSGTGTSHLKGSAQQRDYEHQMSSYLNRDDIPEDMKQAMRQYYKDIHATEQAK